MTPRRSASSGAIKLVLAVSVSLGASGCSSTAKTTTSPNQTSANASESKSSDTPVNVKTKDGSFSSGTGKLPEGFPKDIPLPQGKITTSMSTSASEKQNWLVTYEVADMKKAKDEVKAKLVAANYKVVADSSTSENGTDNAVIGLSKGDVDVALIGEQKPDSAGTLTVTVQKPLTK